MSNNSNRLLIINRVKRNTFGEYCPGFFSLRYFESTNWIIKYTDQNWISKLPQAKIVVLWFMQQVSSKERKAKKRVVSELVRRQRQHRYYLLDYMEDLHHNPSFFGINDDFYKRNFKRGTKLYIITRYESAFKKKFPDCNYYHLPFSIDGYSMPKFNKNPKHKLLLTGNTVPSNYPIRAKIKGFIDKYPIEVLAHPGYFKLEHHTIGREYLNKINMYYTSLATCGASSYNYMVAKYFEIPATGALLFAYIDPIKDDARKMGLKDGENMIAFNEKNLHRKLKYVLNPKNKNVLDRIRIAGYKLIEERHTHMTRFYQEFEPFVKILLGEN